MSGGGRQIDIRLQRPSDAGYLSYFQPSLDPGKPVQHFRERLQRGRFRLEFSSQLCNLQVRLPRLPVAAPAVQVLLQLMNDRQQLFMCLRNFSRRHRAKLLPRITRGSDMSSDRFSMFAMTTRQPFSTTLPISASA